MMKLITSSLLASLLVASSTQAAVIFNSIGNTSSPSLVGSSSGKAINFVIGSGSDYTLNSVVLNIGTVTAGANPIVQIRDTEAGPTPIAAAILETLTISGTFTASTTNTFTSTGLTLQAGTTYWLTVTNTSSNNFQWLGSNGAATVGTNTNRLYGTASAPPEAWTDMSSVLNAATINATLVPEPGSTALVALGGLALILRRRRK